MYHPRDTMGLWKTIDKNHVDNTWYKVHYFQQKSTHAKSKERLHPLNATILPTNEARRVVDEYLHIRLNSLLDLGDTHEFRVYEAHLDEIILPGMGSHHVRETSLTLHPLFGVPYIPASSLKGVVRNWALQAFFAGDEGQLQGNGELPGQYLKTIFGTQDMRGRVQFFDVFFINGYEIVPDVLTVHFRDYYGGRGAPTDDQSINAVGFYGVKGSLAQLLFTVERHPDNPELISQIVGQWATKALCELGIGSKTASGYGRFTSFTDVTQDVLRELCEAKSLERERKAEALAQKRRQREIEEYLATLGPGGILAYEIGNLSYEQTDAERSKSTMFNDVLKLSPEEQPIAAQALKEYWEKTGDWINPSKKQREKNRIISKLLETT